MPAPVNTTAPAVAGKPIAGTDCLATIGVWNGSPTGYAFQWSWGDTGASIAGAVATDYVPTMADLGHTLVLTVTATNGAGSTAQASAASPPVALPATQPWSMSQLAADVLYKLVVTPITQTPEIEDMTYVQQVYASRFANLRTDGLAPWPINSIPTEAQQAVARIVAADCCDAYGISGQRKIETDAMAQTSGWAVLRREYAAEPKRLPIRARHY